MFKVGDRVVRKDGSTFSGNLVSVTIDRVVHNTIWFVETNTWLSASNIALFKEKEMKKFKLQTEMTLDELNWLRNTTQYNGGIGSKLAKECAKLIKENTRKTVTIGGKTYYEDELATALASIKEV
jgi:hypothetical protein